MEKRIDLILDLKRNGFYQVRGLKQGDNFAYLYITLTQNSVPMELDNTDIRINYKVPSGATYFQDSKTGVEVINNTVKIKVIGSVLEESGVVQADISLFTKDTALKITSATFQMLVEPSVYKEEKLPHEYDALQKALVDAESLETTFNTATDMHNILTTDTKQGKELDSTLKQDISIGTTLDNNLKATISTANSTKDNLENVIKTADDKTYATKGELDETKMADEHIETLGAVDLPNVEDGYINIEKIEGNTLVNLFQINNTFPMNDVNTSAITSRVNLKPNTTYTQIIIPWEEGIQQYAGYDGYNPLAGWTSSQAVKFTIGNEVLKNTLVPHIQSIDHSIDKKNDFIRRQPQVIVLEGDYTNKPIPQQYFEGIKSLDSLTVKSVGKNLFECKNLTNHYNNAPQIEYFENGFKLWGNAHFKKTVCVKPNTDYVLNYNNDGGTGMHVVRIGDESSTISIIPESQHLITTFNTGKNRTIVISFITWTGDLNKVSYFRDVQLSEGLTTPSFEPYRGDKIDILTQLSTDKALKRLPNGVADTIDKNGVLTRKIGKLVFDGSEEWTFAVQGTGFARFNFLSSDKKTNQDNSIVNITSDRFIGMSWNDGSIVPDNIHTTFTDNRIGISISTSKLIGYSDSMSSDDKIKLFKIWLKANPTTVYYELAEPVREQLDILKPLRCFKDGHIIIESDIPVPLDIKYPTNFASKVKSVEIALDQVMQSLGGAWRTLLILADRELRMKAIPLLSTETPIDLKNKINEMIGVWKNE